MRRILIFEIFKRMQISQQCSVTEKEYQDIFSSSMLISRAARLYGSSGEVAQMRQ